MQRQKRATFSTEDTETTQEDTENHVKIQPAAQGGRAIFIGDFIGLRDSVPLNYPCVAG